ncbi:S9 family peptidase [Paraferrimonas sp. SM1919]|uniref:alpha/beta hydrolase family protein n=1 Tax=Paraferrimonas sp. SM1919 TaxID=2662263 RepID=UPI0013D33E73|nr:S9 family peptidase [Paraferrimonas sp. SM1919]
MKKWISIIVFLWPISLFAQENKLPSDNHQLAELFSKPAAYFDLKLSPNGNFLAAQTKSDGKNIIVIFDREKMDVVGAIRFSSRAQVGSYYWANNERIVATKEYLTSRSDHPQYRGEIFSAKYNGKGGRYLFGYQGGSSAGSRVNSSAGSIRAWGWVLDPMHHDERHILVKAISFNRDGGMDSRATVYKVNVKTGKRSFVTRSPVINATFLTDKDGQVRYVGGQNDDFDYQGYFRLEGDGDWQKMSNLKLPVDDITPYAFTANPEELIASYSINGEPDALYKINMVTGESKKIASDKLVSPQKVWLTHDTKEVYAVEFEKGYPSYAMPYKDHPEAKLLKSMLASLKGHQIHLSSQSQDGNYRVITAFNDTNSGVYYMYDKKANKLTYLVQQRDWLNPESLAYMEPIKLNARDGMELHGFLTLPNNKNKKNLPLVVMPHGGPHGPRDYWGYDEEVQLLAAKGIAVLQINFRGSGGYGKNFEEAGYKKWGAEIQYDIIDAVKHVINEGIADKDNICIMGGSFGAYSALQSSIIEPDMFKCAIANAGLYDLEMMWTEGDIQERDSGLDYLDYAIGKDVTQLKSFSPVNHVEKLKAALFLAHGGEDERTPEEQVRALIKQLDKHNKPYQFYYLDDEGHGFYKPEHRAKYYEQVLNFLDKHLTL